MQHSPATHCLEVDQLNARLVANELATNLEHNSAFSFFDVIPAESQYFAASKAEGERDHIGAFMAMSLHRLEKNLRLFGRETPTFAVVELRTFCDRSHVARQDP